MQSSGHDSLLSLSSHLWFPHIGSGSIGKISSSGNMHSLLMHKSSLLSSDPQTRLLQFVSPQSTKPSLLSSFPLSHISRPQDLVDSQFPSLSQSLNPSLQTHLFS